VAGIIHSILLAKTAVLRSRGCVIWAICGQSQIWRYTKTKKPDAVCSMLSVISTDGLCVLGTERARARDGWRHVATRGASMCSGLENGIRFTCPAGERIRLRPGRAARLQGAAVATATSQATTRSLENLTVVVCAAVTSESYSALATKIYSLLDTPRRSHVISPLSLSLSVSPSFFLPMQWHACMHASALAGWRL
jgi:hypothetical protein